MQLVDDPYICRTAGLQVMELSDHSNHGKQQRSRPLCSADRVSVTSIRCSIITTKAYRRLAGDRHLISAIGQSIESTTRGEMQLKMQISCAAWIAVVDQAVSYNKIADFRDSLNGFALHFLRDGIQGSVSDLHFRDRIMPLYSIKFGMWLLTVTMHRRREDSVCTIVRRPAAPMQPGDSVQSLSLVEGRGT